MNSEIIEILKEMSAMNSNDRGIQKEKLLLYVEKISQRYFDAFINGGVANMDELRGPKAYEELLAVFNQRVSNLDTPPLPTDNDVWIFGYGSLVWKADFSFIDRKRGYIRGYRRFFYQNSTDHRGTTEHPGRVVTLLPSDGEADRVYGVAYRISAIDASFVLNHLDYRERNGYQRCDLEFFEHNENSTTNLKNPIIVTMYIATNENDSYAGDIPQTYLIATQIFQSSGASGPNRDYFFKLVGAMAGLFPNINDEHLREISNHLENLIQTDEPVLLRKFIHQKIEEIIMDYVSNRDNLNNDADKFVLCNLKNLIELVNAPGAKESILTKELAAAAAT